MKTIYLHYKYHKLKDRIIFKQNQKKKIRHFYDYIYNKLLGTTQEKNIDSSVTFITNAVVGFLDNWLNYSNGSISLI